MTTSAALLGVRRRGPVTVIDVRGDVNASAERRLDDAWDQAVRGDPEAVVLNFEDAGYINSTGIALVVQLLTRARALGIAVRAYGLTPHYREIFEITRLADYVLIESDEDSAVSGADRRSS